MTYLEKEEDFDKLIEKGDVLVDFFATWCGPCKMLSPVLEELSDHFERVKVVKVDIDQFEDLTRRHGIMSVPTMEIYKDGKLIECVPIKDGIADLKKPLPIGEYIIKEYK